MYDSKTSFPPTNEQLFILYDVISAPMIGHLNTCYASEPLIVSVAVILQGELGTCGLIVSVAVILQGELGTRVLCLAV